MKKLNKKDKCFNLKMKSFYCGVALMALMSTTSISKAMETNTDERLIKNAIARPHQNLSREDEKHFRKISENLTEELLSIREKFSESPKQLIILVGDTGAGKSTLAEWLTGRSLSTAQHPNNNRRFIFISESGNIRNGALSGTTFPKFYPINNNNPIHYADCPGFADTRGILQETKNSVYIRELFSRAESVKFIIAESAGYFDDDINRGTHFKSILRNLKKMFNENYINRNSLQDNISLIVTHHNPDSHKSLEELKRWMNILVEDPPENDEVVKGLLRSFVERPNKISLFSAPRNQQDSFKNDDEKSIIINNVSATSFLRFNFQNDIYTCFSPDSKDLIITICNNLKKDLTTSLDMLVNKQLKKITEIKIKEYKLSIDLNVEKTMKSYSSLNAKTLTPGLFGGVGLGSVAYGITLVAGATTAVMTGGVPIIIGVCAASVITPVTCYIDNCLEEKKQKTVIINQAFNNKNKLFNFIEASNNLKAAKDDICGDGLFGKNGALKKFFNAEADAIEINKIAQPLQYLSSLIGTDTESYSAEIWGKVFTDFVMELDGYAKQDAHQLYMTAEKLEKKTSN